MVEAGCGWGALALHMAKNYGVRSKRSISPGSKFSLPASWRLREGLSGQVEFIEDDYRNISGQL